MDNPVHTLYGNRTRIRVCGVCIENGNILLANHHHISGGAFWAPPGGGLEWGEDARQCLVREYHEETGLAIEVGHFLFVCELLKPPLHAIELFFSVSITGGTLRTGFDPESSEVKVISEVRFLSPKELATLPSDQLHGLFQNAQNIGQITHLRGYFKL
jgi:8-oxo-dGTP diphosphatase